MLGQGGLHTKANRVKYSNYYNEINENILGTQVTENIWRIGRRVIDKKYA